MRMGQNAHYDPGFSGLGDRGRTGMWVRVASHPSSSHSRKGRLWPGQHHGKGNRATGGDLGHLGRSSMAPVNQSYLERAFQVCHSAQGTANESLQRLDPGLGWLGRSSGPARAFEDSTSPFP